jgi:hypothetical protein
MNLVGAATGAARVGRQQEQDLQAMLEQAFREQQVKAQLALQQQAAERADAAQRQSADQFSQRLAFDTKKETADEAYRQGQVNRQATADRQGENERGVRRMIGDFLTQRGSQPLDTGARNQLTGMAVSEGVDLPRTVTDDPNAELNEYEAKKKLDLKYRPPTHGSAPNYLTLVSPTGEQRRVSDGQGVNALLSQGWKEFDKVAARTNAPDPTEAESITRTALDLTDRLEQHGGIGAATGAYEMRGFTQDAVDFNAIRDQLVAALALPNLGALKGPMSDKDILFVKQLATRLSNTRLSEPETRTAISEAKTFLKSKLGAMPVQQTPGGDAPARTGGPGPVQRWGRDARGNPVRLQ